MCVYAFVGDGTSHDGGEAGGQEDEDLGGVQGGHGQGEPNFPLCKGCPTRTLTR